MGFMRRNQNVRYKPLLIYPGRSSCRSQTGRFSTDDPTVLCDMPDGANMDSGRKVRCVANINKCFDNQICNFTNPPSGREAYAGTFTEDGLRNTF